MKTLAVYGSLKQGKYNHSMLGEDAEYLGTTTLKGIMTMAFGYPHMFEGELIAEEDKEYEGEVYRIRNTNYLPIMQMELGAGYYESLVETEYGEAIMYYTHPMFYTATEEVISYY